MMIVAVALLILFGVVWLGRPRSKQASTTFHLVRRGDFAVTVVESGTIAAVRETVVRNEVEGTARIIWIVPEGAYVKKGDLLVELDSAQARDQVNLQLINFEKAKFAVEQAKAQLEILKSTTNSDFLAAKLKLKFAKVDHDKFDRGQLLVNLVEASNKLVQADAELAINTANYVNSTNLVAKGYETRQRADADRLAVLNNMNSLIVASNIVWILQEFDVPKQRDQYDGDVQQAEQEFQRVVSQNERKLAQAEADLDAQINTLALNEDKLKRDQKNLEATKIYAPEDGMVVYAITESHFSSESLIEAGATVRNRQDLIKLPDLSRMKVNMKVHESHVDLIRRGSPAFVVLDSAPNQRFAGVVEKVAPLPDTQARWGNPNLKVYNTEVYLTDPNLKIKPGVSAKAEVIITNITDTLAVPIQSVTTYKGKQVVYVMEGGKPVPRAVQTDLYSTKFVQITGGLKEGDLILLSPPFDVLEKDLEGGVLAEDEKAQVSRPQNSSERAGDANHDEVQPRLGASPDSSPPRSREPSNGEGQANRDGDEH